VLTRLVKSGSFLNGRHPAWMRWPIGGLASLLTFLMTFEPVLAREMWMRTIHEDEFHRAARRLSFYARRGWMRLNLSRDMVYVFCNQMNLAELEAMRRFLVRRERAHSPGLVACDLAYVSAMQAIVLAADPFARSATLAALGDFRDDADAVLRAIAETPAELTRLPEDKNREGFAADRASEALAAFAAEMARLSQKWFVLSGTLLGIVREGGFLAHDYDIDAGIMADSADPVALHQALKSGGVFRCSELEWQTVFNPGTDSPEVQRYPVFMRASHPNGIYIDIFVHYREGGTIWHASSLFRWDNSAFALAPYVLAGTDVLGPEDADRYLTENYGNWRVPVTDFNSALDTTNQNVVRNPLSVAIFLRRIWMAEHSNPRGAAALRNRLERAGFIQNAGTPEAPHWRYATGWASSPKHPSDRGIGARPASIEARNNHTPPSATPSRAKT
jgi:hypothetical protein